MLRGTSTESDGQLAYSAVRASYDFNIKAAASRLRNLRLLTGSSCTQTVHLKVSKWTLDLGGAHAKTLPDSNKDRLAVQGLGCENRNIFVHAHM